MRTITQTIDNQPSGAANSHYSPSVPLSVYRELAAELQATQAKLDTLVSRNHQLTQENQLLRQEIGKAVKTVLKLQQLINTSQQNSDRSWHDSQGKHPVQSSSEHRHQSVKKKHRPLDNSTWEQNQVPPSPTTPQFTTSHSSFIPPVMEMEISPETVFIEEEEVSYYTTSEEKPTIGGWRLLLCVLLIILTAFGAGYLIVRPLFQNYSR